MYRKVLIATDGSETAMKAARLGADLAAANGASVLLVHVGDPERGEAILSGAAASLGMNAQTVSIEGNAAEKILEVAEHEGADLIVIGNKGMTGAKRLLLGGVPNHVSHHARCDVLIVKTT